MPLSLYYNMKPIHFQLQFLHVLSGLNINSTPGNFSSWAERAAEDPELLFSDNGGADQSPPQSPGGGPSNLGAGAGPKTPAKLPRKRKTAG